MTKEQKELLLKDLCARLPYGVIINVKGVVYGNRSCRLTDIHHGLDAYITVHDGMQYHIENIKPHLFPLSSMTDEQKQYLKNRFCYDWDGEPYELWKNQIEIGDADELIDWFHKNHFDYRSLISMGLALDATNLNIY